MWACNRPNQGAKKVQETLDGVGSGTAEVRCRVILDEVTEVGDDASENVRVASEGCPYVSAGLLKDIGVAFEDALAVAVEGLEDDLHGLDLTAQVELPAHEVPEAICDRATELIHQNRLPRTGVSPHEDDLTPSPRAIRVGPRSPLQGLEQNGDLILPPVQAARHPPREEAGRGIPPSPPR